MVKWAPKNGCFQCLCHKDESQLLPASLKGSPRSASGLTQDPFKLLLLPWVSECVRFCLCPLSVESVFPTSHLTLLKASPTVFQSQKFWRLSSWCRNPELGSWMWGLGLFLLGETLCNCNYPPVCGLPTWRCGSCLYYVSVPPTHLIVLPSLYF